MNKENNEERNKSVNTQIHKYINAQTCIYACFYAFVYLCFYVFMLSLTCRNQRCRGRSSPYRWQQVRHA